MSESNSSLSKIASASFLFPLTTSQTLRTSFEATLHLVGKTHHRNEIGLANLYGSEDQTLESERHLVEGLVIL